MMQTKSLPALLGGTGRRVPSEPAGLRYACVLLKSAPCLMTIPSVFFARAMSAMGISHG